MSLPSPAHSQDALAVDVAKGARIATSAEIGRCFASLARSVLTFVGYSDSGYEDPGAMLSIAASVLDNHDPARTIVNIGATSGGIGAVYQLARTRGFTTSGIVSAQALRDGSALSGSVEIVFYVEDPSWGGLMAGTSTLSPTSQAIVDNSDAIVAIGGGAVARDEFAAAYRAGKPTRFFAAEMNHVVARASAQRKGLPPPVDFRGALAQWWFNRL